MQPEQQKISLILMKRISLIICLSALSLGAMAQEQPAEPKPLYKITPAQAAAISQGLEKEYPQKKGTAVSSVELDKKSGKATISVITESGAVKKEEKELITAPKK
jgi:hypothetical protein